MTAVRFKVEFPALPLNDEQRARRSVQRRLLFGWTIVCTVDGDDHYDSSDTHIPEAEMFQAAVDFFTKRREGKHNHEGPLAGTVEYSLPMTSKVAAAFGLKCRMTGWTIGWRPLDSALFEEFDRGNLRGFSINGWADHEPSPRGHILRNLRVDEISVVDYPGQPLATIGIVMNVDDLFAELGMPVPQ